jgi:hypothetical protein
MKNNPTECWNNGIVEYWKVKGETHHSILPLFQRDETKELAMGGEQR